MKIDRDKMSEPALFGVLKKVGGLLVSCSLVALGAVAADAATIAGDSTTILRVKETPEDRTVIPLYEYLHVNGASPLKNGTLSFHLGGWARGDLADSTTNQNNNGDLQYGFLSYQGNKSNFQLDLGRQFITEGVASDKVDGLFARSDLLAGFTLSGFIGTPVTTEPNFEGGNLIYSGRLAHSMAKYYSIGVSYLKDKEGGHNLREEEGIDLWLRPLPNVDITGRSSYNSLTNGWMEHAYDASFTPLDMLRVGLSLQQVNYRDYFHHVTTSALSLSSNGGLLDPGEAVLMLGAMVGVTPINNLTVSGDYRHFDYDLAGDADYYGGGASYQMEKNFLAGLTIHRMGGTDRRLKYNEYHLYARKELGRADVTLDFFDVDYDNGFNGESNTWSVTAAAGYQFRNNVRIDADIDFAKTIDLDKEVKGLIKVTYLFGSQGGTK